MREVYENLYCGDEGDFVMNGRGFAVLHACKEPYHRLYVGYTGRGCLKIRHIIIGHILAKEGLL